MAKGILFFIKKRDIIYLQKQVPKKLVPTIGEQFVRLSLRTKDKARAIRTAGLILSAEKLAIEKSWIFKNRRTGHKYSIPLKEGADIRYILELIEQKFITI